MPLILAFLWSLIILAGYYLYHKPVSPDQALALAQSALDLILAALILGGAGGLGRRFLRPLKLTGLQSFAANAAVGLGAFSLIWLALGTIHAIYSWAAWIVLIWCLVFFFRDILAWLRDAGEIGDLWRELPRLEKLLAGACAALVGYPLVVALAPPLRWDALTYHLAFPQHYIASHFMSFDPTIPYAGQPQLAEMLFTWAMQLARPQTAAVLAWGAGVVCLLGILGLTASVATRFNAAQENAALQVKPAIAGWIAVVAVLAGLTFRSMLGWAYTDLFSALFGTAALILLFHWLQTGEKGAWLWLGAICGFAVSVKWTSGIVVAGIFLAPLVLRRLRLLRISLGLWIGGGAVALAVFAPWLIRDLVLTGNPVYPFVFPNANFSAWRLAAANVPAEGLSWISGLTLPISLTWTGVDSAAGFSTDIGPLLVLLAIPALWIFRKERAAWALALILGLTWAVMGTAGLRLGHLTQPRLYFAAVPALAVLAGLGWAWLQGLTYQTVRARRILGAMLVLVVGLALVQDTASISASGAPAVVMGMENEQTYRSANLGAYAALDEKLSALPAGSRVLALWEPRKLYLPDNTTPDYWIDLWRATAHETGDAAAILQKWKAQGYTHLLVYQPGEQFMRETDRSTSPQDWVVFDQLLGKLPAPEAIGNTYQLYILP
jgi:hypothetical protein